MATTIICELKNCIHNDRGQPTAVCNCTALGVGAWQLEGGEIKAVCDSYMDTPPALEKLLLNPKQG
jgi:hypothetical protein